MKWIVQLLLALLAILLAAVIFIYAGCYNVAADTPPSKFESWLLETVRERSIESRLAGIEAPPLTDEATIGHGYDLYRTLCVTCHGGPGVWPDDLAMGLNPVPPSLDLERVQHESDAELFWVIKNGIKHTGMPAFGPMNAEEDIWALVAFVRQLPEMSPEQFKEMAARRMEEAMAAAEAGESGGGAVEGEDGEEAPEAGEGDEAADGEEAPVAAEASAGA